VNSDVSILSAPVHLDQTMANRTAGVERLVREVLPTLQQPYTEDVTNVVCQAIEADPAWLSRYRELVHELSRDVVNNWIGQYVAASVGGRRTQVAAASSSLISTYSKLR
jgi:uncharacterized protein (UPF0297 family)